MLTKNVGPIDRTLRVVLGLAMLIAFFLVPDAAWRWLLLIGIVPLVTGALGSCAIYSLLGLSTRRRAG